MKYLFIGISIALLGALGSYLFWGIEMVATTTSIIGVIFIVIAALFSGAFVDGDRMRANLNSESDQDRRERNKMNTRLLLMAIPCFAVALLFYFLL